jgi:hypothetical protein
LIGLTIKEIICHEYRRRTTNRVNMQAANTYIMVLTVLLMAFVVSVDVFWTSLFGTVAKTM